MTPERVSFNSGKYRLFGTFFVPESVKKPLPSLVYCSGFPGDWDSAVKIAEGLSNGGYCALAFDFRGIRESEGEVDFASQIDDLKAALTYLETIPEVNKDSIGVVGHCMGGQVALVTAAKDPRVKAVVVWDTPGNYKRSLRRMRSLRGRIFFMIYPWSKRSQYRGKDIADQSRGLGKMDPMDYVKQISPRPLLIIHRRWDRVVSARHAHELYEQAEEPKKIVIAKGRSHTDSDSFYSSAERGDGAIKTTLDWLGSVLRQ